MKKLTDEELVQYKLGHWVTPDYDAIDGMASELIDLRARVAQLEAALNLAVSRGCDHCSESIARVAKLEAELEAYRDAVRVDAQMDGPKFMGCNLSQLRRAWEMTRAALARRAALKDAPQ